MDGQVLVAATFDQLLHLPSDRNNDRQFLLQGRSRDVIEEAKDRLPDIFLERMSRLSVSFELSHLAKQLRHDPSEAQARVRVSAGSAEGSCVPSRSFRQELTAVTAVETPVKEETIF